MHVTIAGYMCINDLSVGDCQKHSAPFTIGKSFDTTGPMEPFLMIDDESSDPHSLASRGLINGVVRPQQHTIHDT